MSDDITFCYNRMCKNKKCMRHPINIHVRYIPHSFAYFTECEYWDMPMEHTDMKGEDDD